MALPPSVTSINCVKEEQRKILSCGTNSKETACTRNTAIRLVINVAQSASLRADNHGDAALLANVVSCGQKFAMKVLQAIMKGQEEVQNLFKLDVCVDSVLTTDWPDKLEQFVIQPQNSRAVPGKEQVSIQYGKRHTKFLLLKSKYEIVNDFKKSYPECQFGSSTLLREFPNYTVNPTSRDVE